MASHPLSAISLLRRLVITSAVFWREGSAVSSRSGTQAPRFARDDNSQGNAYQGMVNKEWVGDCRLLKNENGGAAVWPSPLSLRSGLQLKLAYGNSLPPTSKESEFVVNILANAALPPTFHPVPHCLISLIAATVPQITTSYIVVHAPLIRFTRRNEARICWRWPMCCCFLIDKRQKVVVNRKKALRPGPIALPEKRPPKSITFNTLVRFCPST